MTSKTKGSKAQGAGAAKSADTSISPKVGTSSKVTAITFIVTQMFSRMVARVDSKGEVMREKYTTKKGKIAQRILKQREEYPFTFEKAYNAPKGEKVNLALCAENFANSMQTNTNKINALKERGIRPVGKDNFSITRPFDLQIKANEQLIFDSTTVQSTAWTKITLVGKYGARLQDAIMIMASDKV